MYVNVYIPDEMLDVEREDGHEVNNVEDLDEKATPRLHFGLRFGLFGVTEGSGSGDRGLWFMVEG